MSFLTETNGPRTQDTAGNQGWQEAERQVGLQFQAYKTDGELAREARQYIVHIENASDYRAAFVVREVVTPQELFQAICERYPKLCHDSIAMRVSDSRMGSLHRIFYEQQLPIHTESLYVQLCLKKHTPFYKGKIETQ